MRSFETRGKKRTQATGPMEAVGDGGVLAVVERFRPRSWGFLNQKCIEFPCHFQSASASRLSWFPVIPLRAWANDAFNSGHKELVIDRNGQQKQVALKCLLRFDDPSS